MIKLSQLAKNLEDLLNDNVGIYRLNSAFPNTNFMFNVCLNAGSYKKAEKDPNNPNVAIYYINAVMKVISSDIEGDGSQKSTYSASMTTSIEFLIPFSERHYYVTDEDNVLQEVKFGETVHYMLSELLQAGTSEDLTDDNNESYLVGSKYTIPAPGSKEIRSLVGESIALTIYGTHYFIAQGVNSNKIKLEYVYTNSENKEQTETIFATHVGIARRSVSEAAIKSGSTSSKNLLSGTALTITFDAPLRLGEFSSRIMKFLIKGAVESKSDNENKVYYDHYSDAKIKVSVPIKPEGGRKDEAAAFNMLVADAGLNGELGLAASINVRLIEGWGS